MQISPITDSNFKGKIKFDKRLSKSKIDYVNKILDYPLGNGKTLRKRILKGSYDIDVFSLDTRKTIHPKVLFHSKFNKLKGKYFADAWSCESSYTGNPLRIDFSEKDGVEHLKTFLDDFEKYKNFYDYTYNSFGEKIKAYIKKYFG